MPTSVPGNSCSCVGNTPNIPCLFTLPGVCVYYSGTNISASGINTGDTVDTVINKLSSYAGSGTVSGAADGLSLDVNTAKFGQTVSQVGNPAILTEDREIPLGGNIIHLSGTGGLQVAPLGNGTVDTGIMADPTGNLKSVLVERLLGTIYSKNTWANLSDFVNNGATASVVGSKIQFTSGINTFNETLDFNYITSTEKWTIEAEVSVDTKSSTSFGFGFGLRSINSYGNYCHAVWRFDASTGANSGKLIFNALSAYTQYDISSTALSFSAGDVIHFTVIRDKQNFTVNAFNKTTISAAITVTYPYNFKTAPYQANTGRFAIYSLGGQFTLQSLNITSHEVVGANVMSIGDSKAAGSVTSGLDQRFVSIIEKYFGTSIVNTGEGDTTIEVVASLPQLTSLRPKQVLMCIGSNDLREGYAIPAFLARYDSIVSTMAAAGSVVYHLLPFPELTGLDQSPLTNHIIATYPTNRIIDTSTPMLIQSGITAPDLIHPNDAGHLLIANVIQRAGLLQGAFRGTGYDLSYVRDQTLVSQPGGLWMASTLKSDTLAGSGTRVVVADSTGALTVGLPTTFAANGLSVNGTNQVVLGQNVGASGDPAALTSNREIPLNAFTLSFRNTTSTVTLDQLGFADSARIISNTYFTLGSEVNYIICQSKSSGAAAGDFPVVQIIAGKQNLALTYCGVVQGFNFSGGAGDEPFLITTTPDGNGTGKAGDIVISAGRIQQTNFATQTSIKYNIALQPSGGGGVGVGTLTPTAFLHIQAGTAAANHAPLKLTPGVLLSALELGAIEFTDNGTTGHLYITLNQGGVLTRVQIV